MQQGIHSSKQKRKRSRQSSLASISHQGSHSSTGYNNNNDHKAFETGSQKDNISASYNFALVPVHPAHPAHLANQPRLQNGSSMSLLGSASVSAEVLALQSRLGGVEVALNPLNPRSRSQRRSYLSQNRNHRISPGTETPLPSPSIHEVPVQKVSCGLEGGMAYSRL